jgi:glycosyltransferase involved in cell wall biosynthesis
VKAFFKASDYDVVISHGAQSGLMYSLLSTLTLRKNPPHLIFDIGGMNGARNNKIENLLIRFVLKSNPYIICHSKVIIDNYKNTFSNLLGRSQYISFGVDVDDFSCQECGGNKDYILSFGTSKRDYQTLLKAWSRIKTDKKLRLIGYAGSVVSPNVEIVEKVSIGELRLQIANALFVVIPLPVFNYSYGQMSFLQSMSMGKTVIVTETPSSIDYLQDGRGAFLVRPYDVADMKAKIELLLNDTNVLDLSNGKSRQYVIENFSEKQMAEKVEKFIQAVLLNHNSKY